MHPILQGDALSSLMASYSFPSDVKSALESLYHASPPSLLFLLLLYCHTFSSWSSDVHSRIQSLLQEAESVLSM